MARTTAPLSASQAHGTLAGAITYAHARGTTYAKRPPRTHDPKTPPQLARRLIMQYLISTWSTLTQADRTSWATAPDAPHLSNYHRYLKHNLARWEHAAAPSHAYPATENPGDWTLTRLTITRTADAAHIELEFSWDTAIATALIHRTTDPQHKPTPSNLRAYARIDRPTILIADPTASPESPYAYTLLVADHTGRLTYVGQYRSPTNWPNRVTIPLWFPYTAGA